MNDYSFERLLETVKKKIPNINEDRLKKAYELSKKLHEGQVRECKNHLPYFTHPYEVALILSEMNVDEETIISGLLHDTVEDTDYTIEEIEKEFGKTVATIVNGVTKIDLLPQMTKEAADIENMRKLFISMAKDLRVVFVKLADRLHNMRTLDDLPKEKRERKAKETLDIYAPLAHRLGINFIKWELEDRSFKNLYPEKYQEIKSMVTKKLSKRKANLEYYRTKIEKFLKNYNIRIYGRIKHFWSIYNKLVNKEKDFNDIYDLTGIRILTKSKADCYAILGEIHTLYKPISGRFKDYIATPKSNGYQSLHTTVITEMGEPLEIQIRTEEMENVANYGIAAHWVYKARSKSIKKELKWIGILLDWQRDISRNLEFDEIFVFTPRGNVISLPKGSIPIDFAYRIHSYIGNHCSGAKINGNMVPLNYRLKDGDVVEIIVDKNMKGPSIDWLKFVKTSGARAKIRRFLKDNLKDSLIEKGKNDFDSYCKNKNINITKKEIKKLKDKFDIKEDEEFFFKIGEGSLLLSKIFKDLEPIEEKEIKLVKQKAVKGKVLVEGNENFETKMAKCCNPIPYDDIIGYVTLSGYISIHKKNCKNIQSLSKDRFVKVRWANAEGTNYYANIDIEAVNSSGMLNKVIELVNNEKLNLSGISTKEFDDTIRILLKVEVKNSEQADTLVKKIKTIDGVFYSIRY